MLSRHESCSAEDLIYIEAINAFVAEGGFVAPAISVPARRIPADADTAVRSVHDGFYACGSLRIDEPRHVVEAWLSSKCPKVHFRIRHAAGVRADLHPVQIDRRRHTSRESAQVVWASLARAAVARWPGAIEPASRHA